MTIGIQDPDTSSTAGSEGLGDDASARLFEDLYEELRRMASGHMRYQSSAHTLQTTALLGEAYVRLVRDRNAAWGSRSHFMRMAVRAMRSVLVDHARQKLADRRRPRGFRVPLDGLVTSIEQRSASILDLDDALTAMEALGEWGARGARVVELRFLSGLTMPEIAEALELPLRTVERDWQFARAWLARRLT